MGVRIAGVAVAAAMLVGGVVGAPGDAGAAALVAVVVVVASLIRFPGRREWTAAAPVAMALPALAELPAPLLAGAIVAAGVLAATLRPHSARSATTNVMSALCGLGIVAASPAPDILRHAGAVEVGWVDGGVILGVGATWFIADLALWIIQRPQIRRSYRDEAIRLLADWRLAVALVAAAFTAAAVWGTSPVWALITAMLPLAVTAALARRAERHEQLVDLTVRAIGRLPEAAGVSQQGHSEGVATLAVAMGQVDGMAGHDLAELRRAALLHDAGLVEATRPEVEREGFTTADVARWSAALLSADEEFGSEVAIIGAVADPYRRPGADPDPGADRRAQLVKVACRFRVVADAEPSSVALEQMYAESAYAFDPTVIALVRPGLELLGAREGADG